MKRPNRRTFTHSLVAALVILVIGWADSVVDKLDDQHASFSDIHVGLNEPVDLHGHTVTVHDYRAGRLLSVADLPDSDSATNGLWLVFRVTGENRATERLLLSHGGVRYADGSYTGRGNTGLQQPSGVRERSFVIVEVDPDRLEGAVLEIHASERVHGRRRRAVIDLGFDKPTVERLKQTPDSAVVEIPRLSNKDWTGL